MNITQKIDETHHANVKHPNFIIEHPQMLHM
jgi:hypothetical protein